MFSITVTTQAGMHHKWHKSESSKSHEELPIGMWIAVWIFCAIQIIRGIILTFKPE